MATPEPLTTTPITEPVDVLGHPVAVDAPQARPASSWQRARIAVDAAMLAAAAFVAQLGAQQAGVPETPLVWLLLFGGLVIAISFGRGAYEWRVRLQAIDDCWAVVTTTALAAMIILSARVLFGQQAAVADEILRLWAFSAIYVAGGRVALDWSQVKARRSGELVKPTLIVGAGKVGALTAKRLLDHPEFGLKPVGFLDKDPVEDGERRLPILGASWDLEDVVREHDVQHVIVTFSRAPSDVLLRLVRRCEELGVQVSLVPRLYEQMSHRLSVEHVGGLPLLSVRHVSPKSWQFAVKYALDRLVALALLPLALPALLVSAFAVYLSVGRPIFFRQPRVGRDGRVFDMLKFRTMRDPDDGPLDLMEALRPLASDLAPGGVEGSDRRTRVGSILRATSLDELPQLLNVLKGDMSLVGPRPERPEFVRLFEEQVHGYGDRHRVKAGITGWSQVHGLRGKTSISDRAEWDNYYIANWSLWLDVKILLMTFFAVLGSFRTVE
jgi:exopolysaccharide biosynthesis polyprenyl glycosylphosphotransferase